MDRYFQAVAPFLNSTPSFATFFQNRPGTDSLRIKIISGAPPCGVEDFEFISLIGGGCMGKVRTYLSFFFLLFFSLAHLVNSFFLHLKVFLVRKKDNKKLYALKVLTKEWVLFQQEMEHTRAEKDILVTLADHGFPFLVTLHYAFHTDEEICLVLDYCRGGDLAGQLTITPRFPEERVRFLAAEIILALEALHEMRVVYRDLKPENCLLDNAGHVVLTDFGLSKKFAPNTRATTKTFCGTAEYVAPEIIFGEEYSYAVDWWSLGILIYEMLNGMVSTFYFNFLLLLQLLFLFLLTISFFFPLHRPHFTSRVTKNCTEE